MHCVAVLAQPTDTAEKWRDKTTINRQFIVLSFHTKWNTATQCYTVRHTATQCNTLQHTTTHCSTRPNSATHCNTLPRKRDNLSYCPLTLNVKRTYFFGHHIVAHKKSKSNWISRRKYQKRRSNTRQHKLRYTLRRTRQHSQHLFLVFSSPQKCIFKCVFSHTIKHRAPIIGIHRMFHDL